MDETSILQSVCSCIGGQQNVSRVLSSGNKRYLMVKDASAVDLTAVRQVEGVQAAELSRGRLTRNCRETTRRRKWITNR